MLRLSHIVFRRLYLRRRLLRRLRDQTPVVASEDALELLADSAAKQLLKDGMIHGSLTEAMQSTDRLMKVLASLDRREAGALLTAAEIRQRQSSRSLPRLYPWLS